MVAKSRTIRLALLASLLLGSVVLAAPDERPPAGEAVGPDGSSADPVAGELQRPESLSATSDGRRWVETRDDHGRLQSRSWGSEHPARVVGSAKGSEILFEIPLSSGVGTAATSPNAAFFVGEKFRAPGTSPPRLFALPLLPSDSGTVFEATPDNSPGYDPSVDSLTDGLNGSFDQDYSVVAGSGGASSFTPESSLFGDGPGTNGIDLQGLEILGFELLVSEVTLESPGSDPNGDGNWTEGTFEGTLTIRIQQPAPVLEIPTLGAAGLLVLSLAMAGVGLALLRRRARSGA